MIWRARVLYEDQRGDPKGFMLHDLICALVMDARGDLSINDVKRQVDGNPRGGVDRLLRECRDDVEMVFQGLAPAQRFALVDGDEIHRCLDVPAAATMDQRRHALRVQYPAVQLFLIDADHPRDSNTEGLLQVVARCAGVPADDPTLARAIGKKAAKAERDRILKQAAYGPRAVRDCVRSEQPSLAALADALAAVLPST